MISGTIDSKGVRARLAAAASGGGGPNLNAVLNKALEDGLDMVKMEIEGNDDRLFDNSSNTLKSELLVGKTRARKIKTYWTGKSAKYGYVLERGPKQRYSWSIQPSGLLGKGYTGSKKGQAGAGKQHNAGDPVTALRFMGPNGHMIYRRRTHILWTPASLRPHWSWAWGRKVDAIKALIRQRVAEAINNGG